MTSIAAPAISNAAPPRRRTGWIGVDVGTAALKFAQVEFARGQWTLAADLTVPAADGREVGLPEGVRALLSETAVFQGSRAACALPLSAADLRTIELPPGSDAEIREMIAQELSLGVGFSAGQCEFDFWELGTPQQGEGTRPYAVLSVSRELALRAADDLLKAGMKCEALDGIPFALARAVTMNRETAHSKVVAAVDWGHTSVTFVVVAEGRPVFVRSLRGCGLGLLIARMGEELGLTPAECRPLLGNYGLPHPDAGSAGLQKAVLSVAAEPLTCLVDELSKTLAFADRQLRQYSPQSLLLFGGGAGIRNVAAHLASRLERPVATWRLPRKSEDRGSRMEDGGWKMEDGEMIPHPSSVHPPSSILHPLSSTAGESQTALLGVAAGLSLLGCRA